jgi:hypothetical protein
MMDSEKFLLTADSSVYVFDTERLVNLTWFCTICGIMINDALIIELTKMHQTVVESQHQMRALFYAVYAPMPAAPVS